ncbi:hypothetical protein C8R44DRAFT_895909 [Mycena epipterygia]|nr:hypothetical protein C8R44DRAFT_895909 [Mycena epipterygia]
MSQLEIGRMKSLGKIVLYFATCQLIKDRLPFSLKTAQNITELRGVLRNTVVSAAAGRHVCPLGIPGLDDASSFHAIVGVLRHLERSSLKIQVFDWIEEVFSKTLAAISVEAQVQFFVTHPPEAGVVPQAPRPIPAVAPPLIKDTTQVVLDRLHTLHLQGLTRVHGPARPQPASSSILPRAGDPRRNELYTMSGRTPLGRG